MKTFKWNKDLLETLIILWEQNENLYKTTHKDYNNIKKRAETLKKIYLELKTLDDEGNLTLEEVKRKLHMLRIQYSKEFARHHQSCENSNQTLDDYYVPRLWCYDQLTFLRSHYDNLRTAQAEFLKKEADNLAQTYVQPRRRKKENAAKDLEKQILAVKELIKNRPEKKFEWLGKQVCVELNHIQDATVQEETCSALKLILQRIKEDNPTQSCSSSTSEKAEITQGVPQHSAKVCKTEMDEYSEDSMQFNDDNDSTEKDQSISQQQTIKNNTSTELHLYDEDEEANPLSPTNNNSVSNDIDDIIVEEDDILVPKEEYVRSALKRQRTARSEQLVALHEEKAKAETIYFQKKAAYFQKQTENLDIQRKLMILQAQKLRLEIENIRNDY